MGHIDIAIAIGLAYLTLHLQLHKVHIHFPSLYRLIVISLSLYINYFLVSYRKHSNLHGQVILIKQATLNNESQLGYKLRH